MDPLADSFVRFRDRGELDALGAVFDALAPRLMPIALHLSDDPADAEDALQQTFLVAIERAHTFDGSQRLEPWLAGVLANVARNRRRDRKRRATVELSEQVATATDVAIDIERRDLVAHLRTHVDALPEEQRQVIVMQLQHGLAPAEIAEILGVPAGTVRMRIHRGLATLRKRVPAALAVLLVAGLSSRGLAAVRVVVMKSARRRLVATSAACAVAATSRFWPILAMKKILVVCAAVLATVIAWRTFSSPSSVAPEVRTPSPAHVATERSAVASGDVATPDHEPVLRPSQRRATVGALRVRCLATTAEGRDVPLLGARVSVWSGDGEYEPYGDHAASRRSDERGEVVLSGLVPGVFSVSLPALRTARLTEHVIAGEETVLELRSRARSLLTGIVVDSRGQPVSDAEIWVQRGTFLGPFGAPEADDLVSRLGAKSDADGRFVLAIADVHESRIAANHVGYGASFGRYVSSARGDLRLVLMPSEASVQGTVHDANGTPVAGALVTVKSGGDDSRRMADGTLIAGRVVRHVTTDADGHFRFDGLAPGKTKLTAHAPPSIAGHAEIDLDRGATTAVELRLTAGIAVVGTVRHHDGTPARAYVESRAAVDIAGHFSHCDVRPDGSFFLPYQPLRRFVVVVIAGSVEVAVRVVEGTTPGFVTCDIVLAERSFARGRLVDEAGTALPAWRLHARAGGDKTAWCETGANGQFELPLDADAVATVYAHPPDTDHVALVRESVRAAEGIELVVPCSAIPSSEVRGRILTSAGVPVAAAALELGTQSGPWRDRATGEDGTFAFADLPPGTWTLRHRQGGNRTELANLIEVGENSLHDLGDIRLAAVATLIPEFVDALGREWSAEYAGITLHDLSGQEVDVVHSKENGRLVVTAAPGTYRLTIRGTDLVAADHVVDLRSEVETVVRIPLAIGRTRRLTFNGDGREKPASGTPLQVVIRKPEGEIVAEAEVTRLYPDLRGFRYWYSTHTLPMGRYEVTASTEAGLRYQGAFVVDDDLEAPTSIDIPRVD